MKRLANHTQIFAFCSKREENQLKGSHKYNDGKESKQDSSKSQKAIYINKGFKIP